MKTKTEIIKTLEGKTFKEKTIRLTKPNKTKFTLDEVANIVDETSNQIGNRDIRFVVRVMNCYRSDITIKGYNDVSIEDDFEKYYKNKAVDPTKFEEFDQINITMLEGIKPQATKVIKKGVSMSVFKKK